MAAYEVLLLNTAIPQIQAAQTGDTYVVPRDIAFSAALTLSAGTANGVAYLNASKVLTTGSALSYSGNSLTNTIPSNASLQLGLSVTNATNADFNVRIANNLTDLQVSSATPLSFTLGATEQMRLTSSGLEIKQSQLIGYSSYAGIGTNGLAVAGNVGIGTSSPGAKLEVRDTNATILISNSASRYGFFQWENAGGNLRIGTDGIFGIRFDTNASQRMLLDTSGNLGLGVTPSAWAGFALQIGSGTAINNRSAVLSQFSSNQYWNGSNHLYLNNGTATLYTQNDGAHSWATAASGTANTATITNGVSYTIITSGNQTAFGAANNNVGTVFTATSSGTLSSGTVSQNISFTQAMTLSSDGTFRVKGAGTAGSTDAFQVAGTAPADAARIDSSGNLLVGQTATSSYEDGKVASTSTGTASSFKTSTVSAACSINWNSATSGDNIFNYFVTETSPSVRGSITYNRAGGLVAYNVTSDYRAKDISGPVVGSGALIDSVPVYMGKMKGATQERPMFIAHEVPAYAHTGVKDAVDADGKPVYQQMDASALIPVMWAEIQDLRKRLAVAGI